MNPEKYSKAAFEETERKKQVLDEALKIVTQDELDEEKATASEIRDAEGVLNGAWLAQNEKQERLLELAHQEALKENNAQNKHLINDVQNSPERKAFEKLDQELEENYRIVEDAPEGAFGGRRGLTDVADPGDIFGAHFNIAALKQQEERLINKAHEEALKENKVHRSPERNAFEESERKITALEDVLKKVPTPGTHLTVDGKMLRHEDVVEALELATWEQKQLVDESRSEAREEDKEFGRARRSLSEDYKNRPDFQEVLSRAEDSDENKEQMTIHQRWCEQNNLNPKENEFFSWSNNGAAEGIRGKFKGKSFEICVYHLGPRRVLILDGVKYEMNNVSAFTPEVDKMYADFKKVASFALPRGTDKLSEDYGADRDSESASRDKKAEEWVKDIRKALEGIRF